MKIRKQKRLKFISDREYGYAILNHAVIFVIQKMKCGTFDVFNAKKEFMFSDNHYTECQRRLINIHKNTTDGQTT